MLMRPVSGHVDHILCEGLSRLHLGSVRGMTASFISHVGRRHDPRHGPSIYKNKDEDNTRLEGAEFDKHYRDKDDVRVNFTDRRIDRAKNPNR